MGLNSCKLLTRLLDVLALARPFSTPDLSAPRLRAAEIRATADRGNGWSPGSPFNALENPDEIFALIRQQFRQRLFAVLHVVGQDHLAHGVDAIAFKEHMLRAAQADARRAERDRRWPFVRAYRHWCGPAAA